MDEQGIILNIGISTTTMEAEKKKAASPKGSPKKGKSVPKSPQKNKTFLKVKSPTIKEIRKSTSHAITTYAFHPTFKVEAYLYTISDQDDGFLDGYKKYLEGVQGYECDYMEAANFCYIWNRRIPNTRDEVMTNNKNTFWRRIMIRYLTDDQESTAETRLHGAETLRRFLMDPRYTNFPPKAITIFDGTNEENPVALDEFFMDDKIEYMMRMDLDVSELDQDFYKKYSKFADKIWSYPAMSRFAGKYGFP